MCKSFAKTQHMLRWFGAFGSAGAEGAPATQWIARLRPPLSVSVCLPSGQLSLLKSYPVTLLNLKKAKSSPCICTCVCIYTYIAHCLSQCHLQLCHWLGSWPYVENGKSRLLKVFGLKPCLGPRQLQRAANNWEKKYMWVHLLSSKFCGIRAK